MNSLENAHRSYWRFVSALSRTASPYVLVDGRTVCYHCGREAAAEHDPACCWLDAAALKRVREHQESAMSDPRHKGADVRYNARTFKIETFVNTDASRREILERTHAIQDAARGSRNDMVLVAVSEVPPNLATVLWAASIDAAQASTEKTPPAPKAPTQPASTGENQPAPKAPTPRCHQKHPHYKGIACVNDAGHTPEEGHESGPTDDAGHTERW